MDKKIRIAVTGGRDYLNVLLIEYALNSLPIEKDKMILVHGNCPTGADKIANDWAIKNNVEIETFEADWKRLGKVAGPIRNSEMVDSMPNMFLIFPGGRGTMDCKKKIIEKGINYVEYK